MSLSLKSHRFRAEREADWRRLEDLLDRVEKGSGASLTDDELLAMPVLYRAALSSLSVARAISLDQSLIDYLESLCTRAYFFVYGARTTADRAAGAVLRARLAARRCRRCGARPSCRRRSACWARSPPISCMCNRRTGSTSSSRGTGRGPRSRRVAKALHDTLAQHAWRQAASLCSRASCSPTTRRSPARLRAGLRLLPADRGV